MAISTRNNRLAVVVETTEGTLKAPSAVTEYVPEQIGGFTLTRNFNTVENAEIKASLGPAKSLQGIEEPSAEISMYLKAHGTAGTAPQALGELLEAALGTETIDADEELTTAGSTVSVVELASNGSHHPRGSAILVKDSTNGYGIRPVHSQSGESLTLAFDLGGAPATGLGVSKAVTYSPANSLHQTLSVLHYLGNGGAIEAISGNRVVSTGIEITAGDMINATFGIEGIKNYFNPVEITTSNNKIDFDDGGGEENVSIAVGWYRDPHELASAIEAAMDAATTDDISVAYSDSLGSFSIATDGVSLSLLWKTGVSGSDNTDEHVGTAIGFSDAADDVSATSYTADSVMDWSSPQEPSFLSTDPNIAKNHRAYIGDSDDATCFEASSISISLDTPKTNIDSICSESGRKGSIINARTVTITMTALLDQYQADYFRRLRSNADTRFMYAGGPKSGGNWVAGSCFCIYAPTCTLTNFDAPDADGLIAAEIELQTYVDADGNGEFYISFV